MYRPSMNFADRSNKKARLGAQAEKAWCAVHPLSRPKKDANGVWYKSCYTGYITNEPCDIRIEKGDNKNE